MNRIIWVDNAKCFAIFLVVLGHCTFFFSDDLFMLEVKKQLFSPNMHLFAFLSGFISYRGLKIINNIPEIINYERSLILKIVFPNIALSSVLSICSHYTGNYEEQYNIYFNLFVLLYIGAIIIIDQRKFVSKKYYIIVNLSVCILALLNIIGKLGTFWYLTYYFISSSVFAAILGIGRSKAGLQPKTCITISVILLFVIDNMVPFGATSELTLSFVLGMFTFKMSLFSKEIKAKYIIIIFIGLILTFYIQTKIGYISFYDMRFSKMLSMDLFPIFVLRQLYAFLFILLCCFTFANIFKYHTFISDYGRITMGIYTIHSFIILQTRGLYIYDNNNWYVWCFAVISAIVLFILSVWIIKLLEHNNFLSLLFLGYKK